jgi:hypothetical protein
MARRIRYTHIIKCILYFITYIHIHRREAGCVVCLKVTLFGFDKKKYIDIIETNALLLAPF